MLILSFIVLLYTCNFIQNFIKNIIRKIKVLEQYKKKWKNETFFLELIFVQLLNNFIPYTHMILLSSFFSLFIVFNQ